MKQESPSSKHLLREGSVQTNYPGEIVYEDQYQVAAIADGKLIVEEMQESWSPED